MLLFILMFLEKQRHSAIQILLGKICSILIVCSVLLHSGAPLEYFFAAGLSCELAKYQS